MDYMITAAPQKTGKVIFDFFTQLLSKKPLTLFSCFFFSLITIVIIHFYSDNYCDLPKELNIVNISLLSVDIAALAIIFGLLQGKDLDSNAKKAFEEQSITFLGNALFQLIAIIFFLLRLAFHSCFVHWITMYIQIFALIAVFDLIFELYSITSLIKNK